MSGSRPVAARDLDLAREFAQRLAERCDPQLFEIRLFGSRARGEGDEESDLDLFVALKANDVGGALKRWADEVACELTLEHGVLFSVFVADPAFRERHKGFAFLEAVEEEGIPL